MTTQQMQYAVWQRMRQCQVGNIAAKMQATGTGKTESKLPLMLTLKLNYANTPRPSWKHSTNGAIPEQGTWNSKFEAGFQGDTLKIEIMNPAGWKVTKFVLDWSGSSLWTHSQDFTFNDSSCVGEFAIGKEEAGQDIQVIAWFEQIA